VVLDPAGAPDPGLGRGRPFGRPLSEPDS